MDYLKWKELKIDDCSDSSVEDMYDRGFVFTRLSKGVMDQTRSIRINLSKWNETSENRRILKKTDGLSVSAISLPLPSDKYDWSTAKLAKDFYDIKFGPGIMSAQKVKEMLTTDQSNFNLLLQYKYKIAGSRSETDKNIGYAICKNTKKILHYSYPFYDLESAPKDMGMGMMLRAIKFAKESNLEYIYLGSLQRPKDTYKLQFTGIEWFDGSSWREDIDEVKRILSSDKMMP